MFKIEIRGGYSTDVEVPTKEMMVLVVRMAQENKRVSLIRVINGDKRWVLAYESNGWVEMGKV